VILLENSNESNLSPAKDGSSKKKEKKKEGKMKRKRKKESKDWKAKEVKPHMKKLHVSKGKKEKKEDEIYKLLGEILSKERKEITFSCSAKSDVWPHPYQPSFTFALSSIP
jgi:hypothetical protein